MSDGSDSQPTAVISGGHVIDGLGNPPFLADVVLAGDRIADVVHAGGNLDSAAAGVPRIDATGQYVMPGLIDAHCHVSFDEVNSNDELFFHRREGLSAIIAAANARKILQAGVTSIMDADSLYEIGIDLRDAIEADIVPGPRMSVGGNALFTSVGGTAGRLVPDSGVIGYGKVVTSREEIVREVRRQIKNGVDWIKVHVTGLVPRQRDRGELQVWNFEELKLVTDTAHELGIPVVGHCRGASSIRDSARAGFDLILHATYMDEAALEAVVETRVPIVPTFTFQANLLEHGPAIGASEELRDIFRREIIESAAMLRRAYDAGVPMLCGSESGFSLTPYGEWHHKELEVFVQEMDFTPLQAIKAATHDNAYAMKMADDLGAVTPGRLADLLIVDANPAEDVSVLGDKAHIRHVLIGGAAADLTASPPRRDPSGWRVANYGNRILTQQVAQGGDRQ